MQQCVGRAQATHKPRSSAHAYPWAPREAWLNACRLPVPRPQAPCRRSAALLIPGGCLSPDLRHRSAAPQLQAMGPESPPGPGDSNGQVGRRVWPWPLTQDSSPSGGSSVAGASTMRQAPFACRPQPSCPTLVPVPPGAAFCNSARPGPFYPECWHTQRPFPFPFCSIPGH